MNAPYHAATRLAGELRLTAYRPFIDGLRAVSILAVVLYHVGIPSISGGHIGVDVFFVISGFLIISQIVEALRQGSFSFAGFWTRRVLRILPPYLLVLAVTAALAPLVLVMPDEFRELSRQIRDAALMIVNHRFLSQQGYFDTSADTKILLNLWSLAVEEQFYLFAPLLLSLAWWLPDWLKRPALRRHLLAWSALALFAISLAGCIIFTSTAGKNHAFYLTALRAWEFVAGGAIGFLLPFAARLPRAALALLSAAGLAAIIATAVIYSHDTPYPSWRAIVPVFGASAVILAGLANPATPAIRLLASPPMVWIGLVSYSWYLWHWPLLALVRIRNYGERDLATDAAIGLVSLALAVATHFLLERPIRLWRMRHGRHLAWRPVVAGVLVALIVAFSGFQAFQAVARHYRGLVGPDYFPKVAPVAPFCDLFSQPVETCVTMAAGRPMGLVVGDSHVIGVRDRMAAFASENRHLLVSLSSPGCQAVLAADVTVYDAAMSAECDKGKKNARAELARGLIKPAFAILYSRWPAYIGDGLSFFIDEHGQPAADQDAAFIDGLRETVAKLRAAGIGKVLVIGASPAFPRTVPNCLYLADMNGRDRARECGVDQGKAEKAAEPARLRLMTALAALPDVRYIDPLPDFCYDGWCLPYEGDAVLFSDKNHPGPAGFDRIVSRHKADFDWLMQAP